MNDDPIAYFITWTCYGTWLPGDERGWIKWHRGYQTPIPRLADWCRGSQAESAIYLKEPERRLVDKTISDHCDYRLWTLHSSECRTNHVHVVVSAHGYVGKKVRDELKAWCTRRLKERQHTLLETVDTSLLDFSAVREHWWAEGGSTRLLFDEDSLAAAIEYVNKAQDLGGSHHGK